MAKKAERKAREEAERRTSGVPIRERAAAPAAPATDTVGSKAAKKALRSQRPAKEAGAADSPAT